MFTVNDKPARSLNARVRKVDGRQYIGDRTNVFELDDVSGLLWRLADGQRSVSQIAEAVAAEYEVDQDTAATDAIEFFGTLAQHGFIES